MSPTQHGKGSSTRTAVIGGGLAGLVAANALVDDGVDVTIYERGDAGGRGRTVKRGVYLFNDGPHALYIEGALNRALRAFDLEPSGQPPSLNGAKGLLGGKLSALPSGPGGLLATKLVSGRGKVQFGALLAGIAKLDPSEFADRSVREWMNGRGMRPDAKALLEAIVRLSVYADAPDALSAGAVIAQLQIAVDPGVTYLDGGWQRMVDALLDRAVGRGAKLVAERVDDLTQLLDQVDAAIVAVGGPQQTQALIGEDLGLVEAAGPPARAAVLELGCRRVPDSQFILGIDAPVYGSVHAPPAELAPPGHSVVALARYLAPDEEHAVDATRAELTDLAHRLGVADSDIVEQRYLHEMVVTHGMPIAVRGGFPGRPAVDTPSDPRLRIAGDWVGAEGFLADASAASALASVASLSKAGAAA